MENYGTRRKELDRRRHMSQMSSTRDTGGRTEPLKSAEPQAKKDRELEGIQEESNRIRNRGKEIDRERNAQKLADDTTDLTPGNASTGIDTSRGVVKIDPNNLAVIYANEDPSNVLADPDVIVSPPYSDAAEPPMAAVSYEEGAGPVTVILHHTARPKTTPSAGGMNAGKPTPTEKPLYKTSDGSYVPARNHDGSIPTKGGKESGIERTKVASPTMIVKGDKATVTQPDGSVFAYENGELVVIQTPDGLKHIAEGDRMTVLRDGAPVTVRISEWLPKDGSMAGAQIIQTVSSRAAQAPVNLKEDPRADTLNVPATLADEEIARLHRDFVPASNIDRTSITRPDPMSGAKNPPANVVALPISREISEEDYWGDIHDLTDSSRSHNDLPFSPVGNKIAKSGQVKSHQPNSDQAKSGQAKTDVPVGPATYILAETPEQIAQREERERISVERKIANRQIEMAKTAVEVVLVAMDKLARKTDANKAAAEQTNQEATVMAENFARQIKELKEVTEALNLPDGDKGRLRELQDKLDEIQKRATQLTKQTKTNLDNITTAQEQMELAKAEIKLAQQKAIQITEDLRDKGATLKQISKLGKNTATLEQEIARLKEDQVEKERQMEAYHQQNEQNRQEGKKVDEEFANAYSQYQKEQKEQRELEGAAKQKALPAGPEEVVAEKISGPNYVAKYITPEAVLFGLALLAVGPTSANLVKQPIFEVIRGDIANGVAKAWQSPWSLTQTAIDKGASDSAISAVREEALRTAQLQAKMASNIDTMRKLHGVVGAQNFANNMNWVAALVPLAGAGSAIAIAMALGAAAYASRKRQKELFDTNYPNYYKDLNEKLNDFVLDSTTGKNFDINIFIDKLFEDLIQEHCPKKLSQVELRKKLLENSLKTPKDQIKTILNNLINDKSEDIGLKKRLIEQLVGEIQKVQKSFGTDTNSMIGSLVHNAMALAVTSIIGAGVVSGGGLVASSVTGTAGITPAEAVKSLKVISPKLDKYIREASESQARLSAVRSQMIQQLRTVNGGKMTQVEATKLVDEIIAREMRNSPLDNLKDLAKLAQAPAANLDYLALALGLLLAGLVGSQVKRFSDKMAHWQLSNLKANPFGSILDETRRLDRVTPEILQKKDRAEMSDLERFFADIIAALFVVFDEPSVAPLTGNNPLEQIPPAKLKQGLQEGKDEVAEKERDLQQREEWVKNVKVGDGVGGIAKITKIEILDPERYKLPKNVGLKNVKIIYLDKSPVSFPLTIAFVWELAPNCIFICEKNGHGDSASEEVLIDKIKHEAYHLIGESFSKDGLGNAIEEGFVINGSSDIRNLSDDYWAIFNLYSAICTKVEDLPDKFFAVILSKYGIVNPPRKDKFLNQLFIDARLDKNKLEMLKELVNAISPELWSKWYNIDIRSENAIQELDNLQKEVLKPFHGTQLPGGENKNSSIESQIVTLENTYAGDLGDIGSWDEGDIVAEFELVADAIDYDSNPNYRDLIYNAIKDKLNDDLQDSLEECSLDKFASEVRELAKNHQEIKKIIEALNLDRSKKQYNCQVRIKDRDGTCIEIEIGLTDKKDGTVLNQYSNIILIINNKKVEILDFYPNTAQIGIGGFEDLFMVSLIRSILKNDYKSLTINDVDSDYWNRFGFDKLGKSSPFASKDPRMLKFGEHTASISREAMQLWLYLRGYGPKPIEDILKQANTSKDGSKLSKVGSDDGQPSSKPPVIDNTPSPDKDPDGESELLPFQRAKPLQRVLKGINDLAIVIKNTRSIDASLVIKELIKLHDLEYKKFRRVAVGEQLDDIIKNYPAIPDLNIQQLLTKISHALYHCLKTHAYQAPDGATFTDWIAVGLPAIKQLTKILNPDSAAAQITLTRDLFKQFYLASLQNQGRYNFKDDYWPGILNNLPMHSFMAFQGGVLKGYIKFLEVKLNKIKNLERLSRKTNIPIAVLNTRDIALIVQYFKDSDRLGIEDDFDPLGSINSIIKDKEDVQTIRAYSKATLDEFNNAESIKDLSEPDDYPIILENGLLV